MDYASPLALRMRRFGQKMGILRPAVRAFRRLTGASYEEAFDSQLMAEIRIGDFVWDIGANVGFYTTKFSHLAGPTGKILAFEPSPGALPSLSEAVSTLDNVEVKNVALSDSAGSATFYTSTEGSSPTDGLRKASETDKAHLVEVALGDHFLMSCPPNVIKLDVEGFEREVLIGLHETLRHPELRAVFVEVHFLECVKRGFPDAPKIVSDLLKSAGMEVTWTDPSHVVARRAVMPH